MKKLLLLFILYISKLSAQDYGEAIVRYQRNENGYFTQLEYALNDREKVKQLSIQKNDADDFLTNSELSFPNLEVLNISFISVANFQSLKNNPKLKEIFISYSWSTISLPEDITTSPQLEIVSFTDTFLKSLPNSFFFNTSVKEVCLKKNVLTLIPEIPKNNNLHYLSITSNTINKLPSSIINLQKLLTLNLKNCLFTEFPLEILKLKNIQTLDLSFNPISYIPEKLSELSSLERLYLIRTQIKEFPESMKNSSLKQVYMSDDYLTEKQKDNIIKNLPSDCIIEWTDTLNYTTRPGC
ncbi:leucine-rich repeat domain-containing protein [Apibacter sp. HY039]|uniref:leucine-rich repeat domain-containing protein n=1 Tax=Apibacter sp. HY039 TaxID=2501476 RepID=UPI000FEBD77B|nr:leucine-rich repeat domain-containing protein [Apibacter sp. HY039]